MKHNLVDYKMLKERVKRVKDETSRLLFQKQLDLVDSIEIPGIRVDLLGDFCQRLITAEQK